MDFLIIGPALTAQKGSLSFANLEFHFCLPFANYWGWCIKVVSAPLPEWDPPYCSNFAVSQSGSSETLGHHVLLVTTCPWHLNSPVWLNLVYLFGTDLVTQNVQRMRNNRRDSYSYSSCSDKYRPCQLWPFLCIFIKDSQWFHITCIFWS